MPYILKYYGSYAFDGCKNLTDVNIKSLESWCQNEFENYTATPFFSASDLYLNGSKLTKLEIPNSIEKLNDFAFWGCKSLEEIIMSDSVKEIGKYVFTVCHYVKFIKRHRIQHFH